MKANERTLTKAEVSSDCMLFLFSEDNSFKKSKNLEKYIKESWSKESDMVPELGPLGMTGFASVHLA